MRNKRLKAMLLSIALAVALTACGTQGTAERQVVKARDRSITVLEDKSADSYRETALEKLDKLEGIQGVAWLSENEILCEKQNQTKKPLLIEGLKVYPENLCIYSLATGTQSFLAESGLNQFLALVSPDRRHIFYKEGCFGDTAYIMDADGSNIIKLSDNVVEDMTACQWTDDAHVLYAVEGNKLLLSGLDGSTTEIADMREYDIRDIQGSGDSIYIIRSDELLRMDMDGQNTAKIADYVDIIAPSPDHSAFAMVKQDKQGKMTLNITDPEGNIKATLAEEKQIYGVKWSPDGKLLAYSVIGADGDIKGVFVADTKSFKSVQLATDIQVPAQIAGWSPSGKKLLLSTFEIRNLNNYPVTYVMTIK